MRVRNRLRSGGSRLPGRSRAHPALAELVYAMRREVESLRLTLPDRTVVPSQVEVRIAPPDLVLLTPFEQRLSSALGAHICRHASSRGWLVQSWPKVRFDADPTVASGAPLMQARYLDGQTAEEAYWTAAFWWVVEPLRCADSAAARPGPRSAGRRAIRGWLPTPRRGPC